MEVYTTEFHQVFRNEFIAFLKRHVEPLVAKAEEEETTPVELFPLMGQLGYLCLTVPEEFGGPGLDTVTNVVYCEEFGKVCAGIASAVTVQNGIGTMPIYYGGTPEQKQRWLPSAAAGEKIHAFGLTEPNVGSDATHVQTIARRTEKGYVLNGRKLWITNGAIADRVMIAARLMDGSTDKGITLFIVEKDMPGYSVGQNLHKLGHRSSITSELILEDVEVPAENRLGAEGKGIATLFSTLAYGRITVASRSVGTAMAAYEAALEYAKERVQFGKPIGQHQSVRNKLVNMWTEINAARHMCYYAAWLRDQGKDHFAPAAMAKMYAGEMSVRVTNDAVQILASYGYSREYPVERYLRDARLNTIIEGTTEIQQHIIGKSLGL